MSLTINYQKEIPVKYCFDVVVIGGGPSGLCAAIASARHGVKTMLVEKNGFCGGMATAGLVAPFMTSYDSGGNQMLIKGLFEEIVNRLCAKGGAIHPSQVEAGSAFTSYITVGHKRVTPFKAETLKLVADEMLAEAGVIVLYHTDFVDVIMSEKKIDRVIIHEKEGLSAIDAKVIIDCTGDADVATASGVPYELGNSQTGKMQPATMFFRIGNVNSREIDEDIAKNINNFYRKDGINYRSLHWWVEKARKAGHWNLDRVSIGLFRGVDEDEWSVNTSRINNVDGTSSISLSNAEIVGRQQVDEIFRFLKNYVPGCKDARLIASGSTVGIRETRHIVGIRKFVLKDLLDCVVPDDAVLIAANSVDVHGKFGPRSNEYIALPEGKYYGVPFGCMIPVGCSNLLVSGRCISADSEAAGAIRVMPPCMALGQAAGVGAALAVLENKNVVDCDYRKIKKILYDDGAYVKI